MVKKNEELHQPVLLAEVLQGLSLKVDGFYIDATFGRGGHSKQILEHLGDQGRLVVIDQDPQAIAVAKEQWGFDPRVIIRFGSFVNLQQWISELGWRGKIDGILLDLGVSSPQLDDAERGFSFQKEGPLDMRMDPNITVDAATWLSKAKESEIAKVLQELGEERFSFRIARAIVKERQHNPIRTTTQLAKLIISVVPFQKRDKHPATRSFQAIRIYINRELAAIDSVLPQCLEVLAKSGRLVVISFHSLEDNRVKQFVQYWSQGGTLPDLPIPENQLQRRLRLVDRLIRPSNDEVNRNPRARSARCRVMEKMK